MIISFKNTYRGKPSGFDDMRLIEKRGAYVPEKTEFSGVAAALLSKHVGPAHACVLHTDKNGLFTLNVFGIGRNGIGKTGGAWSAGDDTKIINLVLEAESENDTGVILSAVSAFTSDFCGAGNIAIDSMQCTPDGEREYDIDYEILSRLWSGDSAHLMPQQAVEPNRLYLYYVPYPFTSDSEKEYTADYYRSLGLTTNTKRMIAGQCDNEKLKAVLWQTDSVWKNFINAVKRLFK